MNSEETDNEASEYSLLTLQEAADYLGISRGTLYVWRSTGKYDIPYILMGSLVKYSVEDLDNFVLENKFYPRINARAKLFKRKKGKKK